MRALAAAGAEVTLFCYGSGEGAAPEDLEVVRVPGFLSSRVLRAGPTVSKPLADAALAARFAAEARSRHFDVALAHNAEAALAALLVRPATRVPVIYVAHTLLANELDAYVLSELSEPARRVGQHLDAGVASRADGVLTLCSAAAIRLRAQAQGPVTVIPPGLYPQPAPSAESVERICVRAGVEPGHFALYTGNVDRYQDLESLAGAARLLPELPIVVATHGDRDAPDRGLRSIRTRPEEARALLFACAAAVLPRRRQGGFPIKLLNYMEARRAIVARARLVDGLEHGVSAWLVPPEAGPRELATALETLAGDPVAAAKLGRGARSLLELRHSWPPLAKQTLEFMEEVVLHAR